MNQKVPMLLMRFHGSVVGQGTFPVPQLVRFLSSMNKVLQRVGRVLRGKAESRRRGKIRGSVEGDVNLQLVSLNSGIAAAVLGFERSRPDQQFPCMDAGREILQMAIDGLATVQTDGNTGTLPIGYDIGVLMAWRDAGMVLGHGITRVSFRLRNRHNPIEASLTPSGLVRICERIQDPETNVRKIEGRLLMADFNEQGARCRVHPSLGEPVHCYFDDSHMDEVLENILGYVRVVGEPIEDPSAGRTTSIRIHDIEPLYDKAGATTGLLPKGIAFRTSFWGAHALEDLADVQNVKPLKSAQDLFGTWPGDENDGFESAIVELRQARTVSDIRS